MVVIKEDRRDRGTGGEEEVIPTAKVGLITSSKLQWPLAAKFAPLDMKIWVGLKSVGGF